MVNVKYGKTMEGCHKHVRKPYFASDVPQERYYPLFNNNSITV
jgi:hypothetical protein